MTSYRYVPNFPNYKVGDDGSVWSDRKTKGKEWRQLKIKVSNDGYEEVKIYNQLYNAKTFRVHTLVLLAFVGPRPENQQCRHLDGNKRNNYLTNLIWSTRSEDYDDKVRHGTHYKGQQNPNAKLLDKDKIEIKKLYQTGNYYLRELANIYNVGISTIHRAIK